MGQFRCLGHIRRMGQLRGMGHLRSMGKLGAGQRRKLTMHFRRRAMATGSRLAIWTGVLLVSGLLAATLVRLAPGFGMDERLLDARLSEGSREAVAREHSGQADILRYYRDYLGQLAHGDLGTSISLGRPVRELLRERMAVSCRSAAAGLAIAWSLSLLGVAVLAGRRRALSEWPALFAGGRPA